MAATEISIQPLEVNWTFPWGDTWPLIFQLGTQDSGGAFVPDNLTGATARLQLRDKAGAVLKTLTPTLTALTGTVDATQPYTATQVAWKTAKYELELTYADGTRRTEVGGSITVKGGQVTDVTP